MGHLHGVSRPPRWLSATASLSLSALFVAVYGGASWLTSMRADVGTWFFGWERAIPVVPWLVVPYMSLDLFFVAAPFLCTDEAELRTLGRRLAVAILVAGLFFLTMPLGFAFPRPEPTGWTAPIFSALHGFDRPYNLFPSLHIAIATILGGTYHRHSRGVVRALSNLWFCLIGLSAVFTWQHHTIDVAGGFVLAVCCQYLIAERSPLVWLPPSGGRSTRLGIGYACASACLAILAGWFRPWSLPLLWPAVSLAIVASAYLGLSDGITRKRDGRLPPSARLVLGPWLVGQRLSHAWYRRQCRPWDEVVPGVWIGRRLNEREAAKAVKAGVTAVLDLTSEFSEAPSFLAREYLNLPILDLTAPSRAELRAAADFIRTHRTTGVVYVHCKIGYSRSAAAIGAWLLDAGIVSTPDEAVSLIKAARPTLVVRPEAWRALREFLPSPGFVGGPAAARLLPVRT